jgi:hypothetical protein
MLFTQANAEDKKPTEEEIMAAYAKFSQPGEHHKMLEPLAGSWNCSSKMWMDPGAPPTESKAASESKWILGGRFLQEEVTGDMNGMPFHGMGITGYDNIKKEYVSFWIDEMATSFMLANGQMDEGAKNLTMMGTWKDPLANLAEKKFKTVLRITGSDQHVYEMYEFGPDGKQFKSFEITYTRAK